MTRPTQRTIINPFGGAVFIRSDAQDSPTRELLKVPQPRTAEQRRLVQETPRLSQDTAATTAYQGRRAWLFLHRYRGCDPVFFEMWQYFIPAQCSCQEDFKAIITIHPPDFSSPEAFFEWGVMIHNEVNIKLGKPTFTLEEAKLLYRPDITWGKLQQPRLPFPAVTSLSLLPKHLDVQERCLNSWKYFGLRIIAVNTAEEIERLTSMYPQVDTWVECPNVTTMYEFPTQRINSLMDISLKIDNPILLINSDIAIYGDQARLLRSYANKEIATGIRYNWENDYSTAKPEDWGLDAFLLFPEHVRSLPQMEFGIGQTMWDYWLPWDLERNYKLDWITERMFFHSAHPVHWHLVTLERGRKWISDQYKTGIDWEEWRNARPRGKSQ
jgi:hypothetical protein